MLEITRPVAQRLAAVGMSLALETSAGSGTAELRTLPCTCRGPDNPHEHWFLASPLFRALIPGTKVGLALDGGRIVVSDND